MRALFDDCDLSVLHRLMDVNFWGTVNCTKYALPWLQRSRGSLVGISSVAGIHGLPGRTGYSASKYAMTGFLDTIRVENLKKGVHVMTACPGFTASNVRFSALTADGSQQGETPRNEAKMMTPEQVARIVGLGALKYFLLKVDARKTMLFNPEESIDFNGNTGPFIQYTYARIRSILRKAEDAGIQVPAELPSDVALSTKEEEIVQHLAGIAAVVRQAGVEYSPSGIAN